MIANKGFQSAAEMFIAPKKEEETAIEKVPAAPEEAQEASALFPAPFKIVRKQEETKSKRIQLLMKPSLYSKVKASAGTKISVNELMHAVMEEYVKTIEK